MAPSVDLNCDMGESFGAWRLGADAAIMPSITSANIACGFHAGDPGVMRATVRLASDAGVAIGAHPGFPDLAGFGRREMGMSEADVQDMVLYQVAALAGFARAAGTTLTHVKPHGALYNMAARDRRLSEAIARAVASFDPALVLFGLAGSVMLEAGRDAGLRVAAEGFADRGYE
ncbi:MAG TPA: 5-oxoprolinase subunit PxpA, partial [Vicinamibacterales bacterium]|nr:5-oxoprolinase subunit PxpA [Vicinamibacterales bacterium]